MLSFHLPSVRAAPILLGALLMSAFTPGFTGPPSVTRPSDVTVPSGVTVTPVHSSPPPKLDLAVEVKVEFIERFTEYIEWPAEVFETKSSSFNVCTIGEGPLLPRLMEILGKGNIKGRPVLITSLKAGEEVSGCHLLYIAPSEAEQVERILRQIGRSPVLTVGDTVVYGKRGVMINLFVSGSHVRFKINAAAAKTNGLNVSVKLLMLARPEEEE